MFVDSVRDRACVDHTGGSFGFIAANEFFPKQNVRMIALTNLSADPESGEIIANAAFDVLFPEIAAAARKGAPSEKREITMQKALFEKLQPGDGDYSRLRTTWLRK